MANIVIIDYGNNIVYSAQRFNKRITALKSTLHDHTSGGNRILSKVLRELLPAKINT